MKQETEQLTQGCHQQVTEEDILAVAEDILTTHIAAFEELSK